MTRMGFFKYRYSNLHLLHHLSIIPPSITVRARVYDLASLLSDVTIGISNGKAAVYLVDEVRNVYESAPPFLP